METMAAFAMGEANRGREVMVFDWEKAAQIIKERNAQEASAGLASDWEWTGGAILAEGKPVHDSYTYLASTWATPELDVDGEIIDCWRYQSKTPGWSSETKWPKEALDVLETSNGE